MKKIIIWIIISLLNINFLYAWDAYLLDMSPWNKFIFYSISILIPIIIITTLIYSIYKLIKKEKINKFLKIMNIISILIIIIFIILINIKF